MANSSRNKSLGTDPFLLADRTPGPLGHNDIAPGDTPSPLGINDHAEPVPGKTPVPARLGHHTVVVIASSKRELQVDSSQEFVGRGTKMTERDIEDAAATLRCEEAAIRAVIDVESSGSGFFADRRVKILFEAHQFSRLTDHEYDTSHPDISSRHWNRSLYKQGEHEYERLGPAIKLNRSAALQSASWGAFQIMGFNHDAAGFDSVESFVAAQKVSEGAQLKAFVSFVQSQGLEEALRDHNWAGFAEAYNGPGYAKNHYNTRLAAAYARHSTLSLGSRGNAVRALQQALAAHGGTLTVDGVFGPSTDVALRAFQRSNHLIPDGVAGPATRKVLGL
jgi:hypothetical protein